MPGRWVPPISVRFCPEPVLFHTKSIPLSHASDLRYNKRMQNISKLFRLAKPLYGLMLSIALLILTTSLMDLVAPILSKSIIDEIVNQTKVRDGNITMLSILIALTFTISIISLVLSTLSDRLGDSLAGRMRKFLTEKYYDKVLRLPQSYFDSELSGKIINQLNRGIQSMQDFVNNTTNFILPTFLQSIFTIVVQIGRAHV